MLLHCYTLLVASIVYRIFIHSPVDGHFDGFHVLAIVISAAMDTEVRVSSGSYVQMYAQEWDC